MEVLVKNLSETKLVGRRVTMSFSENKTPALWRSFGPRKDEIAYKTDTNLYSVEIFHDPNFFNPFNPTRFFEKWAAVQVTHFEDVPEGMETLTIPQGLYAVFSYKGKGSEAAKTYQYVLSTWLPASDYKLDNRPHFALMGSKYKNEHPDSEEELWFPISKK